MRSITFECESGTHEVTANTDYEGFEELDPYMLCPFCEEERLLILKGIVITL